MREILFRGKRTDNGEWVEGYYCNLGGNHPRVLKDNIFIGKIGRVLEFKDAYNGEVFVENGKWVADNDR